MPGSVTEKTPVFRIWLVRYGRWQPASWDEMPPRARALWPVEGLEPLPAAEAAAFVRQFNEQMLVRPKHIWAVPVAVVPRYEGDLRPGQPLEPPMGDMSPLLAESA